MVVTSFRIPPNTFSSYGWLIYFYSQGTFHHVENQWVLTGYAAITISGYLLGRSVQLLCVFSLDKLSFLGLFVFSSLSFWWDELAIGPQLFVWCWSLSLSALFVPGVPGCEIYWPRQIGRENSLVNSTERSSFFYSNHLSLGFGSGEKCLKFFHVLESWKMGSALFDGGKMGSARFLLPIFIILDGSKMASTRFGWSHIFPSRSKFRFELFRMYFYCKVWLRWGVTE